MFLFDCVVVCLLCFVVLFVCSHARMASCWFLVSFMFVLLVGLFYFSVFVIVVLLFFFVHCFFFQILCWRGSGGDGGGYDSYSVCFLFRLRGPIGALFTKFSTIPNGRNGVNGAPIGPQGVNTEAYHTHPTTR